MLDRIKKFMKKVPMGLRYLLTEVLPESIWAYGVYFKERILQLFLGIAFVLLVSIFTQDMTIICLASIALSFVSLTRMLTNKSDFSDIWTDLTFPRLIGNFLGFVVLAILLSF